MAVIELTADIQINNQGKKRYCQPELISHLPVLHFLLLPSQIIFIAGELGHCDKTNDIMVYNLQKG